MVEIFHSDQVNFPAEVETQVITVNVVKEIFQLEVKIHSETKTKPRCKLETPTI